MPWFTYLEYQLFAGRCARLGDMEIKGNFGAGRQLSVVGRTDK